jgi:hypothetical protein
MHLASRAILPVQAADEGDLLIALDAVSAHRLAFWDAMLWGPLGNANSHSLSAWGLFAKHVTRLCDRAEPEAQAPH